jgi:2-keto-4-pentenoate hydratase/2-oxohepta-3-ene-1,7-dioic acid hydratase in catechol pathway
MRFVSFSANGRPSFGLVAGEGVVDLAKRLPNVNSLRQLLEGEGTAAAARFTKEKPDYSLKDVTLLPVILNSDKILCAGANYATHVAEMNREAPKYPMIFTRFAASQVGAGQPLIRPRVSEQLDFEGELAVIIGKRGRYITKTAAMDHIAGYSCYNDGSVRDYQRHTTQFTPGKNFTGTGGFGPWLITPDEAGPAAKMHLTTRLNGHVMQDAPVSDLLFDIPTLIEYCSTFTELVPGDVIVTGTTGGVGAARKPPLWMKPGDTVEVDIAGVGVLSNPVEAE